ncbi:PAP2 superfamily protein [Entamoeba histolytica HM-1:IMSS-B]|uniref:Inositolphosphotransferase Aur1/Ipt1 domain-containing protein n=6 Tax=Entamoeba histolytica TaxID=5759 RepID=C4LYK4_ENTH1|nr:hypothetical protein, conserved [Entamoeba histolytica HM-1:IMSS]EMD44674.1 PAP2 superfamily protein [Entamoeba histolytica KU27]EMH73772.1 PAP2 superfamily protein [Entamoeba histolytica HM-1:IMSS-B]EMS13218.1 PAP2 superfamily protein [Entamoeba histolytica HM-3:IMSS]ENY62592.1 PAP2 superfamily protein, putative [Entamoeba histolytica HM-1:IMSS-A]GAT93908.1 hypothetical protein conserved [Entamoeba histolytica]|eukprot:XP_649904.2 hypothetical protein, conserved [Entamoeba histolytica HM-1:IMSS]
MNKFFKSVHTIVNIFKQNTLNFISLWIVVFGFFTSFISQNFRVVWVCYIYQMTLIVFGIFYQYTPKILKPIEDLIKMFNCFLLTLGLAFNFISTTEMIKTIRSTFFDQFLVSLDSFLFPHFSEGQISLMVDSSKYLNPTTFHGKLLNDYFELIYITFYIWGYLSFGVCCLEIIIEWWKEKNGQIDLTHKISKKSRYIEMEYLVICWSCTFSLIFLINIIVPGKSPRLYLKSHYTHSIQGFGFSSWWRNHVDRDDSSGTFPSGHCGETLAVAFGIYYSHKTIGKIVFVMTFLICVSTIWNRYHYLSDLIMGILCSLFGYIIANLHLKKRSL